MATIPLQTKTNSFLKIEDDSIAEILVIVYSMDVLCNWIFQLLERQWDILYTTSFRWHQRKKSRGFRSGEYGAQTKLVFRLITRSPKFLASQFLEASAVWGGAPSCISHWLAMSCPRRRRHILNLFKMGMYLSEVTDWQFPSLSSKKNGPMIPWLLIAAQTVTFFECNFSQILDSTRFCIFY